MLGATNTSCYGRMSGDRGLVSLPRACLGATSWPEVDKDHFGCQNEKVLVLVLGARASNAVHPYHTHYRRVLHL